MHSLETKKASVASIVLFALAAIFLEILYFQHKIGMGVISNSDNLYYPLFLKTIFLQKIPYHSWHASTGLGYFPNMFFLFISLLITNWNLYFATALYMLVQLVVFYWALTWFIKSFLNFSNSLILSGLTLLLYITIFRYDLSQTFFFATEFSLVIITLLVLSLILRDVSFVKIKPYLLLAVFVLVFLCVQSSSILLAWCVLPLIAALTYLWLNSLISRKKYILWMLTLLLSIGLGSILRKLLAPNPITFHPFLSIHRIPGNISYLYQLIKNTAISGSAVFLFSMFVAIALNFSTLFFGIKHFKQKTQFARIDVVFILSFLLFLSTLLMCTMVTIGPVPPSLRYITIQFVLPFTITIVLLYSYSNKTVQHYLNIVCLSLTALLTLVLAVQVFIPFGKLQSNYMPNDFSCIYKTLAKYHVNHGIAGYWDAKPLIAFSPPNNKLTVAAYLQNLSPYLWLTTSKWYHSSYNFAILPQNSPAYLTFTKQQIEAINGSPAHDVHCGQYEILIYPKNNLYTSALSNPANGNTITLVASSLNSQVGLKKNHARIAINNKTKSGFLTFGPYLHLSKGSYLITLKYKANKLGAPASSSWFDVSYNQGTMEAYRTHLTDTNNEVKNLTAKINVPGNINNQYEFRVFYTGHGDLTVYNIKLKKLT